jgi:protein-tyrosine phosphatase
MAAEYFRYRAALSGLSHVVVDSAGTLGIDGVPASTEAVQVLREAGLDLRHHRSKGVDDAALRTSDVLVGMTQAHLDELGFRYRRGESEWWLLRAFEEGPRPRAHAADLEDPIGSPVETYREQFVLMSRCLDHLALYVKYRS